MFILPTEVPAAFILHPKTGCRSIVESLRLLSPAPVHIAGRHGVDEDCIRKVVCVGGLVVGTVRNPYDILVSWYHSMYDQDEDVSSFLSWIFSVLDGEVGVDYPYLDPQKSLLYGHRHMNRQIRFENGVQSEYNKIMAELGLPRVDDFLHVGRARNRVPWQRYYTRKSGHEVYLTYKEDFINFGYKEHT